MDGGAVLTLLLLYQEQIETLQPFAKGAPLALHNEFTELANNSGKESIKNNISPLKGPGAR